MISTSGQSFYSLVPAIATKLAAHRPAPNSRDTVIQLKLYNRSVDFWKKRYKDRSVSIKVTPVRVQDQDDAGAAGILQDSSIIKISILNEHQALPSGQEQFGHRYDAAEFVIFITEPIDSESVTFMIDFYAENDLNGCPTPEKIGFCYILPFNMRGSSGSCTMPITGNKNVPIGQLSGESFSPFPVFPCQITDCVNMQSNT